MTTATTRQAIRRALYDQIGRDFGFYGTATAITSTTITHAAQFADTTLGTNHYRGHYIYRPDVAAVDQVRKISEHVASTGIITQAGLAWSDTSDLDYEIVFGMYPTEIDTCIQRAMRRIFYPVQVPLSPEITDGDMDANNTTSWSDVLTPTKSKVTTASKVFSGLRALRVLNNAALEGVQSTTVRGFGINGQERVYVSAVVHVDVGTAELHLYDVTNSASIASVTSPQEGWVHLWLEEDIPNGTEEIAVRLLGTSDTTDLYWNHVVLYRRNRTYLPAPSWLDEQFKFEKLREARYITSLSTQNFGGYDDATSRIWNDWRQPSMFTLDPLHLDTNPYQIQLMRRIPRDELWIQAKRPYSDSEALSTDASTTLAPLDLVYAYATDEIARVMRQRQPTNERWKILSEQATLNLVAETQSRPETPEQPLRTEHWGRI